MDTERREERGDGFGLSVEGRDEYDDAEAEGVAVQKAHSSWRSSDEEDEGDEEFEVAALTGSSSGDSADSGLGSSPHGNQFDLSERGSTVSKAPTAKLRLIVRLASDDQNEHSDVVSNLVFKLPADTHDKIMSEVILEVMPEAEQETDNTQGDDHPPFFGTCELAWARSVPRRCLEDSKLGSVLRNTLVKAPHAKQSTATLMKKRSKSIQPVILAVFNIFSPCHFHDNALENSSRTYLFIMFNFVW
ncbi:hypothetical protein QAD02_013133 [Eretmocerus hayati]|uniref:Uncharacterized protein n=1 Tax=Eretmocerus hayati TaxID=131215 RepID=A0ACC2P1P7_9HYME|nr:hypothetical protein QAD02_013133 [Eretmocerus hayati]